MIFRALQLFASLLCLLTGSTTVPAQGTIQFGFEQFAAGSTPPFVTQLEFPPPFVDDSTKVSYVQPFEGAKFLWAHGTLLLKSPDQQPIEAFTIHVWMSGPPPGDPSFISVGGQPVTSFGAWQTFQGSFASPVESIPIRAFYNHGESFSLGYAIDGVELTTIPEPQTYWLLTLGLGAILLRRSKSLKTQFG